MQQASFELLRDRIEQSHRRSLLRTVLLSVATVTVAAGFLVFTLRTLSDAERHAHEEIAAAQAQVGELEAQLAQAKQALANALDLGKHIYTLDWGELKMMYVENGPAVQVLDRIEQLKDGVRWGLANTPEGGYTSAGFAQLILQQLDRLPQHGNLTQLPRDDGPPQPGDVVVYDGGYNLFYFRDHERREFVIGMTPFGVASLNYDFGVKRDGVRRSGFPPH